MSKLTELKAEVLEDGIIDAAEVAKIEAIIYEDGKIDEEEAIFMFEVNDAVSGKENAPEWTALFVKAISDYVLADDTTPGVVDADEATFLIASIQGDDVVDAAELALLVNLAVKAEAINSEDLIAFTLDAVKAAVIADGVVDAEEVAMIRAVIYGEGGAAGSAIDRTEADMLFDINDATTDNEGHDAGWVELFVEAISSHVLDDAESPNEIDADEGDWLVGRIEGDDTYDTNEKALLANIKAKATKIDGKLSFKIEMFA